MLPYISEQISRGVKLSSITRHMLGMFPGQRGARQWRQILTVEAVKPNAGTEIVLKAFDAINNIVIPARLVPDQWSDTVGKAGIHDAYLT